MAQQGSGKKPDLGDYVQVKDRVREFHRAYPTGTIRTRLFEDGMPFRIQLMRQMYTDENSGETREYEQQFIVVVAEAQREPGQEWFVGSSYEPYPGRTPYTRYSELENAETSAWGRALAALGIGIDKSMASRTEVENRSAEREQGPTESAPTSGTRRATSARPAASGGSQGARRSKGPTPNELADAALAVLACQSLGDLIALMQAGKAPFELRNELVPPDVFRAPDGSMITIGKLAAMQKDDFEREPRKPGE